MPTKLSALAVTIALCGGMLFAAMPAFAQPKAGPVPAEGSAEKALADACYAPYGLKPAEKIKICSKAIESGTLKSVGLAMAFYNRAAALASRAHGGGRAAAAWLLARAVTHHVAESPHSLRSLNASSLIMRRVVASKVAKSALAAAGFCAWRLPVGAPVG